MKSYRVSLLLAAGLIILSLTARSVAAGVAGIAGPRFLSILCLALVIAVLVIDLIRVLGERSGAQLPAVILGAATVLFIMAGRPLAHLQLVVAACFVLGTSLRLEKRRPSWAGMVFLVVAALAVSAVAMLRSGGRFMPMDAWIYLLAGLSGYCAAGGWKR